VKVAFNASQLLGPLTGVGQYALQLARALQQSGDVDLEFFYLRKWSRELTARPAKQVVRLKTVIKRCVPFPYEFARAVQQQAFTRGVRLFQPALYHEPSFLPFRFDGPTILTVHDLSWIRFPKAHPAQRVRILDKLLPRAIDAAAKVIVDSEFVREEVVDHYRIAASRVTAIPLAARDCFYPRSPEKRQNTLLRLGLTDRSYFLFVGTLEPRKNLELALLAHASLPWEERHRCPLVFAGSLGWHTSALESRMKEPVARGELILPGFVSDEELADLYSGAVSVLYPSRYEGFGLPPLEAMQCGTPVILSDASSLPEVGGQAAVYHDADDAEGMASAMRRMLLDPTFREERSAACLLQAARFSWSRCAQQTLASYRDVLAQS